MKNQFVTLEIAQLLKQLNFTEDCFGQYVQEKSGKIKLDIYQENLDYIGEVWVADASVWSHVIDWLRIKHDLCVEINSFQNEDATVPYYEGWVIGDFTEAEISDEIDVYFSYESAREQTILEALKMLKAKQK